MRGKVCLLCLLPKRTGITPAYAGKRAKVLDKIAPNRDHPRVCGEKVDAWVNFCNEYRITPAYAGKSAFICGIWLKCRDHPRVCGEKKNG